MTPPLLSVVIPTQGRASLAKTLLSILGQGGAPGMVETLVVYDTHGQIQNWSEGIDLPLAALLSESATWLDYDGGGHSYGHAQINYGLDRATGLWVLAQDDDDIFAPGAFNALTAAMAELDQPRPLLCRFRSYHGGRVFWTKRGHLAEGAIGGHCLVTPNLPGLVGRFTPRYAGDFDWIIDTLGRWPNGQADAVWVDQIISIARPS